MALIKLEMAYNFRNFGEFGGNRASAIFRSGSLDKVSENDIEVLRSLGIGFIIDLRSEDELEQDPHILAGRDDFGYISVPLSDDLNSVDVLDIMMRPMKALYIDIVNGFGGKIADIFRAIAANAPDTGLVFHCTIGKDRAGVVSALLLSINGVPDEDIIGDYSQSFENLRPFFEKYVEPMIKMGVKIPEHVLRSDPESMRDFLAFFKKKYTGAEEYLLQNGVSKEDIMILKNLL